MSEVTSNLEVIPDFAFSAKGELTTVNLPEATYIGRFAFSSAAGATSGSGSGSNAEGGEGDEGEDMNFNNKKLVTVVMPKVTNIESSAFAGDENLEISSLPSTLLVIQDKAFQGCPKVQLTAFPENLTYLGDAALDVQDNLDIDTLPPTLMYLGGGVSREQITNYLSQYVDSGTGILDLSQVPAQWLQMEISDNILQGNSRFYGLDIGTEIEIPSGILVLANYLFREIVSSVDTIILPEGLLSIGERAFSSCNALTTLTLPSTLTSIGSKAFDSCGVLTTLDLSNTQLTSVGDYVFHDCFALIALTLPNILTSIGNWTFSNCRVLTTLDLSNTQLTSIGDWAFSGCNALTTLTLPNSLTSIGKYTFSGCSSLTTIDMTAFDGLSVPYLASSDAFYANSHAEGFKFLFSSQEALNAFANETNWSDLAQYFEVQA